MRFDLIGQQVQYFLLNSAGILTDMKEIMVIRRKAGYISTFLEYFEFASLIMMQKFTNFEMVHRLIHFDCNWVIIHYQYNHLSVILFPGVGTEIAVNK